MYVAERKVRALAVELGWEIDEQLDDVVCIDLMTADGEEIEESIYIWMTHAEGKEMTLGELQNMRKTYWESALQQLKYWRDRTELAKMVAESIHSDTNI